MAKSDCLLSLTLKIYINIIGKLVKTKVTYTCTTEACKSTFTQIAYHELYQNKCLQQMPRLFWLVALRMVEFLSRPQCQVRLLELCSYEY